MLKQRCGASALTFSVSAIFAFLCKTRTLPVPDSGKNWKCPDLVFMLFFL